jgi:hypothetical protein
VYCHTNALPGTPGVTGSVVTDATCRRSAPGGWVHARVSDRPDAAVIFVTTPLV